MHLIDRSERQWHLLPLLLALFAMIQLVVALPVTRISTNSGSLSRRTMSWDFEKENYGPEITKDEYLAYLNHRYPATDHYILFTGGSKDQVYNFQDKNPGYYALDDFFGGKSEHFKTDFPQDPVTGLWRGVNGDLQSEAIAETARGPVMVFGAAEYAGPKGENSFYTTKEAPILKASLRAGRIQSINHMVRDATSKTQILATEDANGRFTWTNGRPDTNANPNCRRALVGDCYPSSETEDPKPAGDKPDPKANNSGQPADSNPKSSSPDVNADGTITKPFGDPAAQTSHSGGSTSDTHGQTNTNSNSHGGTDTTSDPAHGGSHGTTFEGGIHL